MTDGRWTDWEWRIKNLNLIRARLGGGGGGADIQAEDRRSGREDVREKGERSEKKGIKWDMQRERERERMGEREMPETDDQKRYKARRRR